MLIVANNTPWVPSKVQELEEWFAPKVRLMVDVEHTGYTDIPFTEYIKSADDEMFKYWGVDRDWYDRYITAEAAGYDIVMLVLPTSQWRDRNRARGWRTDRDQGPVELQVAADELEHLYGPAPKPGAANADLGSAFFQYGRHEIMHALFMLTGQPDTTHYWWEQGMDKLSNALAEVEFPVPHEAEELSRLQQILTMLAEILRLMGILRQIQSEQPQKPPESPQNEARPTLEDFCDAIEAFEDYVPPGGKYRDGRVAVSGSVSWKNNNPGNLKYVGQALAIGKDKAGHAKFRTYGDGRVTLERMVANAVAGKSKVYRPSMTFLEFFTVYAEENYTQYAKFVADWCKAKTTTRLVELVIG